MNFKESTAPNATVGLSESLEAVFSYFCRTLILDIMKQHSSMIQQLEGSGSPNIKNDNSAKCSNPQKVFQVTVSRNLINLHRFTLLASIVY